ncbi:MAG: hypothetical protein WC455_31270 [Dehalococcoidia bacterium]|jgi:hypothetical protein
MTFNMKKARDYCERMKGYADPDGGNYADFAAAGMLPDALDLIDAKDKQIATLKAACIEEMARGDYFDESQECEGYWWDRKNTTDVTQNDYREMAKEQLARELPEIGWEDMK